jgi:hypothetical protein
VQYGSQAEECDFRFGKMMMFTSQDFCGVQFNPQGMENGKFPALSPGMSAFEAIPLHLQRMDQK